MTYIRPTGVTYTAMAMWIDDHVYSDTCDETLLYEYLYHLSNMLAHQSSYFDSAEDYDQFALFSASRLLLRLNNSKQFEYDDYGQPKMKQIKSILNYLKKVIYPYKVDFELEFKIEHKDIDIIHTGSFDLGSHLTESISLFDTLEFSFTIEDVSKIVRSHLSKIPRKKRSSEWINIYISCMLTLIDSMTLSNVVLRKYETITDKIELLEKLYSELKYNDPILFHLPDSMSTYIKVLVNELRHVIASEVSWKSESFISADDTLKSLICTAINQEDL